MFLNLVNPDVTKRDKLKKIIINYNKDKTDDPDTNINITLDGLYCREYINSTTDCIFINFCRDNYKNKIINNNNIEHFYFITFDTMNPQLTYMRNITENKINTLNKMFHIENFDYKINNNGDIYIIMNNLSGNFLADIKIECIQDKIINLINTIRYYTNKKIYIRPHVKNLNNIKIKFYTNLIKKYNNVYIDTSLKINMNNVYCVFIQNTKFMFHFTSHGIPIYNLDLVSYNYFPEIYINDITIIDKLNDNINILPNIKDFMYKYYKFMYTEEDLTHPEFLNKLVKDYINYKKKVTLKLYQ